MGDKPISISGLLKPASTSGHDNNRQNGIVRFTMPARVCLCLGLADDVDRNCLSMSEGWLHWCHNTCIHIWLSRHLHIKRAFLCRVPGDDVDRNYLSMSGGFEHWCHSIYSSISWLFFSVVVREFCSFTFPNPEWSRNEFIGKTRLASVPSFVTTRAAWMCSRGASLPIAHGRRPRHRLGRGGG
jgi:hypothetical protein